MSIFDRMDRITSRQVDRIFSVAATVDCLKSTPNGRPQPDQVRGEIVLRGIFDQYDSDHALEAGSRSQSGNDFQTIAGGQRFEFSVDLARYPAAKDVRQGDRLTLDDGRKFEVASTRKDGMSRVVLHLIAPLA